MHSEEEMILNQTPKPNSWVTQLNILMNKFYTDFEWENGINKTKGLLRKIYFEI